MKRQGFTIIEMAIVILVLGIMASIMTFSPEIAKQSAKREAERVTFFLNNKMRRADLRRTDFIIEFPRVSEALQDFDTVRYFYIAWRCPASSTGDNIIQFQNNKYKREAQPFSITGSCTLKTPVKELHYSRFNYTNIDDDGITLKVTGSQADTYNVQINKQGMISSEPPKPNT